MPGKFLPANAVNGAVLDYFALQHPALKVLSANRSSFGAAVCTLLVLCAICGRC